MGKGKTISMVGWAVVFLSLNACTGGFTTVEVNPPPKGPKGPPPWAPAHGYRAKFRYRYWPAVQIYYDLDRGLYFYFYMNRWRCSPTLPPEVRIRGDFVVLEMDTDKPYEFHSEVVHRYPPGHRKKKHH